MLLERRPNAVAQREIYDELWPDTIVDFANLHNLVSQVRAAIGDRDHSGIRTVYGFGFSFSAHAQEMNEPEAALPSPYALLLGETAHPLRLGANVVGRSAAADVKVFHPSLSRNHTRIVISRGGVTIEDLESKNGTYVNAARIDGVRMVTPSDRLRFGTLSGRIVSDDLDTEDVVSQTGRPTSED
jgi:hypothetical protein